MFDSTASNAPFSSYLAVLLRFSASSSPPSSSLRQREVLTRSLSMINGRKYVTGGDGDAGINWAKERVILALAIAKDPRLQVMTGKTWGEVMVAGTKFCGGRTMSYLFK